MVNVKDTNILTSYKSDHSPVSMTRTFIDFSHGKGLRNLNNSLLSDIEYLDVIKMVIHETNEQYALLPYNRDNLEMVPDDEIKFFLRRYFKKFISYSSYKKKKNDEKEKKT